MFLQLEDAPIVKANPFEDPVAVKKAMIENRDFRIGFRDKLSVEENRQSLRGGT